MTKIKLTPEIAQKLIDENTQEIVSPELVSNPLVSVSLVTYNHAKYFREAIDSVLAQKTDFPFEIVIGDDCSDDGTTEIAKEYQSRHPDRIRLLMSTSRLGEHTGNGRLNMLRTLHACRGRFTSLLEGDDFWLNDEKLKRQVNHIEKNPSSVECVTNHLELRDNKTIGVSPIYEGATEISLYHVCLKNQIATASAMFRTSFLRTLPEEFHNVPFADWALHFCAAQHGPIQVLAESCVVYRRHAQGIHSLKPSIAQIDDYNTMYQFFERRLDVDEVSFLKCLRFESIFRLESYDKASKRMELQDTLNKIEAGKRPVRYYARLLCRSLRFHST